MQSVENSFLNDSCALETLHPLSPNMGCLVKYRSKNCSASGAGSEMSMRLSCVVYRNACPEREARHRTEAIRHQ